MFLGLLSLNDVMYLQKVISKKTLYMIRMAATRLVNVNGAGAGAAAHYHPPPPLPHRLHLDRRHPHAPTRRQAQVAPTSLSVLLTVPGFDSRVAKLSG